MRVLIGTPVKDMLPSGYVKCLTDLIIYTQAQGIEVGTTFEHGGLFYARDRICKQAISEDYDYCLQIDSDQTFPPDALCKMLARGEDIVTGLYVGMEDHHKPVIFTELHPFDGTAPAYAKKHGIGKLIEKSDFFEVEGCGAGFLLISNHALRVIRIQERGLFECYKSLGEDVSFCWRARHQGFKIYCDASFEVGHLKFIEYSINDWDGYEEPSSKPERLFNKK